MSNTNLDLYRAVRVEQFPDGTTRGDDPASHVLEPDFYARKLPNGTTRAPDVTLVKDRNGMEWVKAGGGTSLFDKPNVFKGRYWLSFHIPNGTPIPESLKVVKGHYKEQFTATHYQIEVNGKSMRKLAFEGALDNFARSAVAKLRELATV